MKPFIVSLYALFILAMASGVFVAYRNAEGLVETDYYEKGSSWFRTREQEAKIGLAVEKPESLSLGNNEVSVRLQSNGGPIRNADVRLFVGNVSSSRNDRLLAMRETAPGVYQTSAVIPSKGKWLLRLDLDSPSIKTSRSWFYTVD